MADPFGPFGDPLIWLRGQHYLRSRQAGQVFKEGVKETAKIISKNPQAVQKIVPLTESTLTRLGVQTGTRVAMRTLLMDFLMETAAPAAIAAGQMVVAVAAIVLLVYVGCIAYQWLNDATAPKIEFKPDQLLEHANASIKEKCPCQSAAGTSRMGFAPGQSMANVNINTESMCFWPHCGGKKPGASA